MRGSMATWQQRLTLMHDLSGLTIVAAGVGLAGCVVWALVRALPVHALAALVTVLGATTTAVVLKRFLLTRPDFGYGTANTLPSGHVTVAMSTALAVILVVPASARLVADLVAVAATAPQAFLTIAIGWHRPSDVLAAALIALAWTAIAVVLIARAGERRTPPPKPLPPAQLVALLALVAIAGLIVVVLPLRAGLQHSQFVQAGVLVLTAAMSALVVAAVTGLLDWLDRRPGPIEATA
jgi:hypothetical protein